MAACRYCNAQTELFHGDVPACVKCFRERIGEPRIFDILLEDLDETTRLANAASESFCAVAGATPSSLPHPDGTQRIHNASRQVTIARMAMLRAHHRLNDFLNAGIVPDDLKQSG